MQTFDLRRRCALYLTYYRYGDTRKRGMAMLAFKAAYRCGRVRSRPTANCPTTCRWCSISPALARAARRCCAPTGPTSSCCGRALRDGGHAVRRQLVEAVCAQLPKLGRRDHRAGAQGMGGGPPREEVGLEPFAPPEYLAGTPAGSRRASRQRENAAASVLVGGPALRSRSACSSSATSGAGATTSSAGPAAPPSCRNAGMLKWGGPLFHYGTFAAIAGHVIGILIPEAWTKAIGIPESAYRWFSAAAGTLAAVLVIGGVVVLATRAAVRAPGARHHRPHRLRHPDPAADHHPHRYRTDHRGQPVRPRLRLPHHRGALVPWPVHRIARRPAIANAPFIYQLHATAAWLIWALWPFSRLVHAWSYPLWYLWRPYIVYRSRTATHPAEPGTGGRKWRKIGVPY